MKLSIVFALVAVLLFVSCSDDNPTEPLTGTIKGKVINSSNQLPLADVAITTVPPSASVLTDMNGLFEITNLEEGQYTVVAKRKNFATQEVKVSVKSGKTTDANIVMTDTVNINNGSIEGTVVDEKTGQAIANVSVSTIPATSTITTDSEGKFKFDYVPAGNYSLIFQKTDYIDKNVNIKVNAGQTTSVNVKMLDKQSGNNPPDIPVLVYPSDGAQKTDSAIVLKWECSDPDNDELTYDVFVSINNPPETMVAENFRLNEYTFYAQTTEVNYYWKVIAKDKYGAFSESEVRSFQYKKAVIPDEDLILYYTFDNANAYDESGNGNNGELKNNVGFMPGVSGKAASLIGTSDLDGLGSHILLPNINFASIGNFTISLWIKERQLRYFAGEAYINWGNASTGWIGISNFIKPPENENLVVNFSVGCVAANNYEDQEPVWVPFEQSYRNKWVHYAMVYKNGVTYGYINGELVGQKVHQIHSIQYQYAAIGKHWWNYSGTHSATSMDFDVDEVRVYKRALSENEIKELAK